MGAQGSQSGISYIKEISWGSTPSGQFKGTNFVSETMAMSIENKVSNNVRPDRQTADLVQVGASTQGGVITEFQSTNIDDLLPGFLWAPDWVAPPTGESVTFVIEGSAGVGGTMVVADSLAYTIGHTYTIAGSVSNDGRVNVTAIPDGTTVQFRQPMVTESTPVAVTFTGETIRNGVTRSSFSIERANNDVSQFFLYKGMVPNTIEFKIESGSPVMANLEFVGKDETLSQTTSSTPAASEPSITPIMNSLTNVGEVSVDNAVLSACLLQKINFKLDNKVEGKTGIGLVGFCDAVGKSIELKGSISLYFNDNEYYDRYIGSLTFSLEILLQDTDGSMYIVNLPKCKFDAVTANVSGRDDDVMLEGSFIAILSDEGYTLQLTRFV